MRRILLNKKYEHLRDFIGQLPARMEDEGTYIYGGRRNLIKLFTVPDGTQLNVKRYKKPPFLNNIIYSTGLRKPKGLRAYTYPSRLLANRIETPEAVAYIEDRQYGLLGYSYFVSIQCPYTHRLYEVGNAPVGTYEDLALALALFVSRMHEAGICHQDFSPGNVLWEETETGVYKFSIVDINRMYFGSVGMKMGCRSFSRLWGPKEFIRIIATEYACLRGFDEHTCVQLTMKYRARFWKYYQKKRDMEFKLEI